MNGKQLKNSILQWAIQGKLVPQDPNDEPASVLLEKIRAEKERLVKEGKLKKKDLEVKHIAEDEIPFEIPKGWEWVKLGFIAQIARGGSPRPIKDYLTDGPGGINWIKIGDTDKGGKYINACKEKIKLEGLKKSRKVSPGDFLLTNSMSYGRPYITNIEGCIHDGWLVLSPFASVFQQSYLYYVLSSPFAFNQFSGKVAGAVVQNLNSDKVADSIVPLPPLAEQHRIVAKIEELMPLVEKCGETQEALEEWNNSLPEKLKKSILQEAIQGKLVPQDPNDEPASVLLERIREEKKRLVEEGKLKKKDLEVKPIEEEELPFEVPESWSWCRIGEISESYIGLTYKPSDVTESGTIVLRSSNIKDGKLVLDDLVRVSVPISNKLWVKQNDIIICARNGSKKLVGKSAIVNEVKEPMTFGAFMAICKTSFHEYVYVFLQSELFYSQLRNVSGTTTINQLTQNNFNSFLIPLPPLAEQRRIVAKIEELFGVIKK